MSSKVVDVKLFWPNVRGIIFAEHAGEAVFNGGRSKWRLLMMRLAPACCAR